MLETSINVSSFCHCSSSSSEIPGADMVCSSLSSAVDSLDSPPLSTKIESVYILGGSSVYAVSGVVQMVLSFTLYNIQL